MKRFRFLMIRLFLTMGFFILAGTVSAGFDSKDSKKPPGLNEAIPLVLTQNATCNVVLEDVQFYRQSTLHTTWNYIKENDMPILVNERMRVIKSPRDWVFNFTKNTLVATDYLSPPITQDSCNHTSAGGLPY